MSASGFAHDVLFFDSTDELLDVTVPFAHQGVAAGEATFVVNAGLNGPAIADALRDDPGITHVTRDTEQRPARTLSLLQSTVERALTDGAPGVRIVGDVGLPVRPSHWHEWMRFEAAFNAVLGRYPVQAICPWNARRFSDEALRVVRCTHPTIINARARLANPDYRQPEDFLRRLAAPPAEPLQHTSPSLVMEDVSDPAALRSALRMTLAGCQLSTEDIDEFVTAVNEVATNAVQHGRPPVQVTAWCATAQMLCQVRDHGPGLDDPLIGYATDSHIDLSERHFGIWLARRTCDRLDVIPDPEHFTIRLSTSA